MRILEPWTQQQKKKVVLDCFSGHLKDRKAPRKEECLRIKEDNKILLKNKSWEKIKIFVVNAYKKQLVS